jgi:hypothetical protein
VIDCLSVIERRSQCLVASKCRSSVVSFKFRVSWNEGLCVVSMKPSIFVRRLEIIFDGMNLGFIRQIF